MRNAVALSALVFSVGFSANAMAAAPPTAAQVLTSYGDIAQAMYGDAHATAKTLQQQVTPIQRPSRDLPPELGIALRRIIPVAQGFVLPCH